MNFDDTMVCRFQLESRTRREMTFLLAKNAQ